MRRKFSYNDKKPRKKLFRGRCKKRIKSNPDESETRNNDRGGAVENPPIGLSEKGDGGNIYLKLKRRHYVKLGGWPGG